MTYASFQDQELHTGLDCGEHQSHTGVMDLGHIGHCTRNMVPSSEVVRIMYRSLIQL
jgi:hypothetical protein